MPDFRTDAAAARSGAYGKSSLTGPPLSAGISCCVFKRADVASLRTRIKVVAVLSAIFGIGGVLAGGVLGGLMKYHVLGESTPTVVIAAVCSVGGILTLFVPTYFERWIVRSRLSQSSRRIESGDEPGESHVSVEEATSYGRLKLLAEDVGLLTIHPDFRCARINGLTCEYQIFGKDVVELSLHANGKTVLIGYRIGETQLNLAIVPRSLKAELQRQTTGSSSGLYERIVAALQIPD
jgi:hypothetical protein